MQIDNLTTTKKEQMQPTTIFVTGATGFIGTKLVNELVRQGHTVHALTRAASNRDGLNHERIMLMQGDIMNRESLLAGMNGCTHVFHLAAYAKNWARDPKIFYDHNVIGMKNVFDAAKQVGIQRVVWTSTIVTFGPTCTRRGRRRNNAAHHIEILHGV